MVETINPIESFFKIVDNFESENPDLISKRYKGIEIYPVVKLTQLSYTVNKNSLQRSSISKKSKLFVLWTYFIFLIKYCYYYLKYPLRLTNADVIIFTANLNKRFKFNGKYSDAFFDSIRDYLISKSIIFETLERIKNFDFRFPGFHDSSLFEHILWFSKIKSKLDYIISKELKKDVKNLLTSLNHELDGRIVLNEKKAINDILYVAHVSHMLEKYLRKKNTKCIIMIPYYGYVGIALTNAAKKLNIKAIDIQHGVQGDYHIAYGSWKYSPIKGWNSLPDYFLVWSEFEKGALNSLYANSKGLHSAIVCGNLLLIDFLTRKNYFDHLSFKIKEFVNEKGYNKIGLITLQDKADLNEILLKAIGLSKEKVFWIIRPHHSNTEFQIKILIAKLNKNNYSNYDILFSKSFPLFAVLQVALIHMTEYSSTVIEANYFNVPSIITSDLGKSLYKNLIESGDVIFADQNSDVISFLDNKIHSTIRENSLNTLEMNEKGLSIVSYGNAIMGIIKNNY